MIVVISSQSIKKAARRVEAVIDAYLTRIGSETWMGKISEEGLGDIRKKLSSGASRHSKIVCYRVRGKDNFEIDWIIGNDSSISNGSVAVSKRKAQITKNDETLES